jgi:hypothetical protein
MPAVKSLMLGTSTGTSRSSLLPYSPGLNRIEIVSKHAKYFWRRFVAMNGAALLDEIRSLIKGFGTEFTVNFS